MKTAYELLQHMVALASRVELFVEFNREKLHSRRLDIPIPSSGQTGLEKVAFGVNDPTALRMDAHVKNTVECKSSDEQSKSSKVSLAKALNKIIRWSFTDVIYLCGKSENSELAEQLMLQVSSTSFPSIHSSSLSTHCTRYYSVMRENLFGKS